MRRKKRCPLYPNSDCESGIPAKVMSALPPKADMCGAKRNVCFGPIADIVSFPALLSLCDPKLSAIECFDAQDSREVPRDLVPAFTLVETGKHRAAIGPKVEPHRLALVTSHGLPKYGEVAGHLRQSIAKGLPGPAAVP